MKSSFIFLLLLLFVFSCQKQNDLDWALSMAKENRIELEKVLAHYQDDSLKYKAACFLIENMPYHFSIIEFFVSPYGEKYRPDLTQLSGVMEVRAHCDSLLQAGYNIKKFHEYDITVIDSGFLIKNINVAFLAWQKPWARNVSFEDFCRYILPYRSQQEKISNLRGQIMERYIPMLDSLKVETPLEACFVLNKEISNIMRYDQTGLPFYPTNEETYYGGISQCEGLCNLGAMIMRSVGIPVAIDQTVWVRMDLGHNWCAVLDNGKFYPFGPGEDSPDLLAEKFRKSRWHQLGNVYRFSFAPHLSGMNVSDDDGYKTFLKNVMWNDVTEEYADRLINIQVFIDKEVKSISSQVYLCTYNDNIWKPVAMGNRDSKICHFESIVGDNVYAVCCSPDGYSLCRITAPFYVSREGEINKLIPKTGTRSVTLKKNPNRLDLPNILRYWEPRMEDFVELKYAESTDTTQFYNNIPVNALLWFSVPIRMYNQRIFIIEGDSLRYY